MKERLLDVVKWGLIIIIVGGVLYFNVHSLKGESLITFAMMVTALATILIAIFAGVSHRLASKIQSRDEEFRQQVSDLYQAIALSNLMIGKKAFDTITEENIETFKKFYTGKTIIF